MEMSIQDRGHAAIRGVGADGEMTRIVMGDAGGTLTLKSGPDSNLQFGKDRHTDGRPVLTIDVYYI